MKLVVLVAILGVSASFAALDRHGARPAPRAAAAAPRRSSRSQSARPTSSSCVRASISTTTTSRARSPRTSARWRSIRPPPTFPPTSPICTCDESRVDEAIATAEQALKIAPANSRGASRARHGLRARWRPVRQTDAAASAPPQADAMTKAIQHLEQAIEIRRSFGRLQRRARCSRGSTSASRHTTRRSAPARLVKQEPGWQDGATAAGRGVRRRRPRRRRRSSGSRSGARQSRSSTRTLGDFYARERRWTDAANAYEQALEDVAAQLRLPRLHGVVAAADRQAGRRAPRRATCLREAVDDARRPTSARCICCRRPSGGPATPARRKARRGG